MRSLTSALLITALLGFAAESRGQMLPAAERQSLVALYVDRGGRATDFEGVLRVGDAVAAKGLPVQPITNKIREGVAKGASAARIEAAVRDVAASLEAADRLLRDQAPAPASGRDAALILLAESIAGGLTSDEVRELGRQARTAGGAPVPADVLASGAKSLSMIKEARLSIAEGTAVVAEGTKQGYRPADLADLGREIRRRERDYQTGRATLRGLRDAIARGDRPEQLFRERPEVVEPVRPEMPTRPERTRPDIPERPTRQDRPERPVRPDGR